MTKRLMVKTCVTRDAPGIEHWTITTDVRFGRDFDKSYLEARITRKGVVDALVNGLRDEDMLKRLKKDSENVTIRDDLVSFVTTWLKFEYKLREAQGRVA